MKLINDMVLHDFYDVSVVEAVARGRKAAYSINQLLSAQA
jgi:hypothetical protein